MSYLESIREHKKTYIVITSLVTVIVLYNEMVQFAKNISLGTWLEYLGLIVLFVILMNAAINLRIWEKEK